jgi:hypothetical protein
VANSQLAPHIITLRLTDGQLSALKHALQTIDEVCESVIIDYENGHTSLSAKESYQELWDATKEVARQVGEGQVDRKPMF